MFTPTHQLAQTTGAAIDQYLALYTAGVHALFDAGQDAAEHYADHLRTFLASATVNARQCVAPWPGAGALGRFAPVLQHPPHIGTPQSQPTGTVPAHVSDPELATGNSRATR